MNLRKTDCAQCYEHSPVQQSIVKWFFVLLLVMVAFSLHLYSVRFSATVRSKRKSICAAGVDDESLARLDLLDNNVFGGDSDVSDAASSSNDLESCAQQICVDENLETGESEDEKICG